MFRYAVLYFALLILFLVLIVGPSLAGKYVPASITGMLDSTNLQLVQPTNLDNNDTIGATQTGTGAADYTGALQTMEASASATASAAAKIRLF